MLDFIKDETKIYIAAPANYATGGPELLHQLAYKLKASGKQVYMYYWPADHENPVHENYRQYNLDYVVKVDDNPSNVLIVPEIQTRLLDCFKNVKKMIWWLSVDNYFLSQPKLKGLINRILLNTFGSQKYWFFNKKFKFVDGHLVQSKYAEDVLVNYGLDKIYHLSDYLHDAFLKVETDLGKKQNIVVYNPKKGIKFTKKLMDSAPEIEFVPIENMTREQVVSLLQRAKVYIDFGFHPGKDRIPREAAFLGCCVITNQRGSAGNSEDLPILEEFKFDENANHVKKIIEKIHDCFDCYDQNVIKFDSYKIEIQCQEKEFENQMKVIFG